jgi:uncharacterized membrane protein YeaQ/YmgE (transglycosylase-associated protein family)
MPGSPGVAYRRTLKGMTDMTATVIVAWLLTGLIIGAVAHLMVPGRQRIGLVLTIGIGIVGALVGGFVTAALIGPGHALATFVVALIVAALLLVAMTRGGYGRRFSSRRRRPRWLR